MIRKYLLSGVCLLIIGILSWRMWPQRDPYVLVTLAYEKDVMGTEATLSAVTLPGQEEPARAALAAVRQRIEHIESLMSHFRDGSDIGRLNRAPVGLPVKVDPETLAVLRMARDWTERTGGVFDVTCGPLMELWNRAGQGNTIPTTQQIAEARKQTGWANFELLDGAVVRLRSGARLDLGGIAKKYAIDQSIALLRQRNLRGALVNIGGDIACFGTNAHGSLWQIGVKDPFDPDSAELMMGLETPGLSVCTSGNYERFVEINGKRYSHIKDPRTGRPADLYPSVSVIAPTAVQSGVWATALSILGPDGLKLVPADAAVEAFIVSGDKSRHQVQKTPGFDKYVVKRGRWK